MFQHGFEQRFEGIRALLCRAARVRAGRRPRFLGGFAVRRAAVVPAGADARPQLLPGGRFGQIILHVRAPVGTRIEETAALFDHIEDRIRQVIPPDQLVSIVDNIGLPVSGINRAYSNTGGVGPQDGDILVTLVAESPADRRPSSRTLREVLPDSVPRLDLLVPAGRHHQPDPELRRARAHRRSDRRPRYRRRRSLRPRAAAKMSHIAGIADVRVQQSSTYPELSFDVDRTQADRVGITERDVTNSLAVNLAGSFQIAPAFWLNPKNGVSYPIVVADAAIPDRHASARCTTSRSPAADAGSYQILGGLGHCISEDRAPRSSRIMRSSRPSTSMPRPRAATSARSRRTSRRIIKPTPPACRRARRSRCAVRSRR